MIVKNEEQHLATCLESIKDLVDEIVIVDTGSTDKTIEIAKRYTDKIYNFTWCNDFGAARNEALKHCTGDWILRLDADEVLDRKYQYTLCDLTNNDVSDVVIFPIHNYTDAAHAQYKLSKTVRLFKNLPCITFKGRVHEEIDDSVLANKLRVGSTHTPIFHYGYLKTKEVVEEKFEMYKAIAEKEIEEDPNNFKPYFSLAAHYAHYKMFDEAIANYKKSIEFNDKQYMVHHDLAMAIYERMMQSNQSILQEVKGHLEKSKELIPASEFGEYKNKLEENIKAISSMIKK